MPTGVLPIVPIVMVALKFGEPAMGVLGVAPAGSPPATDNVTGWVVPLTRFT